MFDGILHLPLLVFKSTEFILNKQEAKQPFNLVLFAADWKEDV